MVNDLVSIISPLIHLVLVDAAFFLAILLYSLVRPIHLAAWWYPVLFYIQVRNRMHMSDMSHANVGIYVYICIMIIHH